MKARKVCLGLGVAMALASMPAGAWAEEAAAEPAATAAASVDVASAYIFRGGTVNDKVNVQPSLEGSFYGATLGTWGNLNTDSSQFDEIDYYVSYDLPLNLPVGFSVGYTEYTYPTAGQDYPDGLPKDSTSAGLEADREINVGASHELTINDKTKLASSLTGNFGIEGPFLDKGINVTLDESIDYAACDKTTISFGATGAAELGDNFAENGVSYAQLNLGASYGPLSAGAHYVIETDKDVLAVDKDFYGTVGVSLPL